MRLRQLLPVASLGLLAALLAHTASYGGSHVVGGSHHAALELLALAGVGGFIAVCAALAWLGAGRQSEGSVLAAAMRPLVPSFGSLLIGATSWFVAIESMEPAHLVHVPLLVIALALIAAAAMISFAATWFVRAIAAIAIAIASTTFARRLTTYSRRFEQRSSARRTDFVYRRFARPPPALTLLPI
ncbi:MAG TPA: hypothetical protein VF741_04500 [Candidatus Aquilonibacter sp.]